MTTLNGVFINLHIHREMSGVCTLRIRCIQWVNMSSSKECWGALAILLAISGASVVCAAKQ